MYVMRSMSENLCVIGMHVDAHEPRPGNDNFPTQLHPRSGFLSLEKLRPFPKKPNRLHRIRPDQPEDGWKTVPLFCIIFIETSLFRIPSNNTNIPPSVL